MANSEDGQKTPLEAESLCKFKEKMNCSLYILPMYAVDQENYRNDRQTKTSTAGKNLSKTLLENAILEIKLSSEWQVSETLCGLIALFARDSDVGRVLQELDLAKILNTSVQVLL